MALTNQATITLSVNVQNMAGLTSLTKGLQSLRSKIMAIQRNPAIRSANGVQQSPAQQIRQQAALVRAQTALSNAQQRAATAAAKAQQLQTRLAAQGINTNLALQRAQQRAASAQQRASITAGQLSLAQQRLNTALARNAAAAKRAQTALGGWTNKVAEAEQQVDALWRASFRLQMLGSDLTRAGQRIFDAMSEVTNEFGEFEFMALRAAGALSIFNTDSSLAVTSAVDLQDAIMGAAKELRLLPVTDVAKAVYFWGSTTGQVVETHEQLADVMGQLTPIIQSATMTQTDYETAIKGTYSILAQYYPTVVDAARATGDYSVMTLLAKQVTEGLFYATQKTALEFDDLIQSFKMVGPVAAGVGASFEDIVDLLGRLGNLGIRGSMAGRALRQMFIQMARPPKITLQALNNLIAGLKEGTEAFGLFHGKSFIDIMFPSGQFVGTQKFLQNMYTLTKDLNVQQRIAILGRFSTANLLPAMIALVAAEGREIEGTTTALERSAQQHDEWASQFAQSWGLLSNSFSGVQAALQRSIEVLRLQIGRALADVMKPMFDALRNIVDQFAEWVKQNPEIVQAIGKFLAVAGAALVVLGSLFALVGSFIALFTGLWLAAKVFGKALMKISGVGLVVIGIIDALARGWATFQGRIQEAAAAIGRAINNITGYFNDGSDGIGSFVSVVQAVFDMIVDHATNAIVVIAHFIEEVSKFKVLFDLIKNVGIPLLGAFFSIFAAKKLLLILGIGRAFDRLAAALVFGSLSAKGFTKSIRALGAAIKANWVMIAAVIGLAAYENNWLGFKSLVDAVTASFRDLNDIITKTFDDLGQQATVTESMGRLGASSAMTFLDEWKAVMRKKGRGLLPDLSIDFFSGTLGQALTDIGYQWAANEQANQYNTIWERATVAATNEADAIARINTELEEAGLNVNAYWAAWLLGEKNSLHATSSGIFGQALTLSVAGDGVATIDELTQAVNYLLDPKGEGLSVGDAAYFQQILGLVASLNDEERARLGIETSLGQQIRANMAGYDETARNLMANLMAFDPLTTSIEGNTVAVGIIDSLTRLIGKVSPEVEQLIQETISVWTAAAATRGFDEGFNSTDVQGAIKQALIDLGKTTINADVWSDLVSMVNDTLMQSGEAITSDGLSKAIQTSLEALDIKSITDTTYAVMQGLKDGMSDAIHSVFKPDTLAKALKGAIGDDKGIKNFMKQFTGKAGRLLERALSGELGSEKKIRGMEWLTNLMGTFETAWPGLNPKTKTQFRTQIESLFSKDTVTAMNPAMQVFATNILTTMYSDLGEPVPQWLFDIFTANGGTLADAVELGWNTGLINLKVPTPTIADPNGRGPGGPVDMGDGFGAPGMVTQASNLVTDAQNFLTNNPLVAPAPDVSAIDTVFGRLVSDASLWGAHLVENFASSIRNNQHLAVTAATNVANAVSDKLKFSKGPDEGPLKGFNEWGTHMMQNYAASIEKGAPAVARAAQGVAQSVASAMRAGDGDTKGKTGKNGKDGGGKKGISVKGAHLYNTYDGYLEYLDDVHSRIGKINKRTRRDHREAQRELRVDRNNTESSVSYESNKKKVVEIRLTAESPDGTVNRTELRAIRRGVTDALNLADIEHMVTVQ